MSIKSSKDKVSKILTLKAMLNIQVYVLMSIYSGNPKFNMLISIVKLKKVGVINKLRDYLDFSP